MKLKRNTWMPFYVGDYLRDTLHLTAEQHGAYLLLILAYWTNGELPATDGGRAAVAKLQGAAWRRAAPILEAFFTVTDGLWMHGRIEKERARAFAITELRSMAGKEGAGKRWQHDSKPIANGMANGSQPASQNDAPSQSPRITSTESVVAREAACVAGAPRPRREERSGMKKLSDGTSAILKATFEAAVKP